MKDIREGQTPCKECPYLKISAPRYLGGYSVETYANPITADIPIPCHKTHGKATEHYCVGLMITRVNSCKSARLPALRQQEDTVRKLNRDVRSNCFSRRKEFEDHHTLTD